MSDGARVALWHDAGVDDRALVDAIRSGDLDAFSMLVELETRSVYRTCLRILGRPEDAEDVTQEAFLAAHRSIRSYRGDGALRAWLLRIATRLAIRKATQRRPVEDIAATPEGLVADITDEPTRIIVAAERQGEVRRAVSSLPEPYREVVALRFFAELSLAEVADATGRPVNTVKTHLRRGLQRLRPLVGSQDMDR